MPCPLLAAGLALFVLAAPSSPNRAGITADLATARALEARERWAPAESLATATLSRLEGNPAADSLQMAEALQLLGIAKWRRVGYFDPAGPAAATRALGIRERRLGADDLATAESHALVARFLAGNNRNDSALVHVRRALEIRAKKLGAGDTLIADTWDQTALVYRNQRDMRSALDAWQHAIAIRERAEGPESPEIARLLAQTGVPYMELGDLDRAHEVLERSLAMFARVAGPNAPGRVTPLNILSDVEHRSGNDVRRIDLLREALRVLHANGREDTREGLTIQANYSIGLSEIGDVAGASVIARSLLPKMMAQYGPENPRTLSVRWGLAIESRSLGDSASAMRHLQAVQAVLEKTAPHDPMLNFVRGQSADILFCQHRDDEAVAILRDCVESERAARPPQPATLAEMQSQLLRYLAGGDDTLAIARALTDMVQIDSTERIATTYVGEEIQFEEARAANRLGRREEAWQHALEGERLSREKLALGLQLLPDRRALDFARQERHYLEQVILFSEGGGPDRVETAWDRLVRQRGLVRAEIARRRPAAGAESDTALAGAHERWLAAQRLLARRLVANRGAPRDSATQEAIRRLQDAVEENESDYAKLLASHGAASTPAAIGLADVRSRLGPHQSLVGFYRSTRTTGRWEQVAPRDTSDFFAFVLRDGHARARLVRLGTSIELRAALEPWRERVAVSPGPRARPGDRAEEECRRTGRRARAAVWDRIAPLVAGSTDVFLVCDDAMLDLPWQALPDGAHGYLVEKGPRLHVLNAERELAEPMLPVRSGALLAVGAPDFDRGSSSSAPLAAALVRAGADPCAGGRRTALAPLPASGAEARDVARAWRGPSTVLTGADATEAEWKREAPGHAVIHLATHGVVTSDTCGATPGLRGVGGVEVLEPRAPEHREKPAAVAAAYVRRTPWMGRRIWLALAGANHAAADTLDENEGFLTAEEVLTLDLTGTDWVVLSACHSGLAEAWSRDGTLGMRRAFDLAGARTVIASQWSVEDEATREWMAALYAARAAGETSAAAAMESASRGVLAARRKSGRSTHPFYWAAFSGSGE